MMPDSAVSLPSTESECRISEIEIKNNTSKGKRDISLCRRKASEASSSSDRMSVVPSHLLFLLFVTRPAENQIALAIEKKMLKSL